MNHQTLKNQLIGILAEQGDEYLSEARKVKDEFVTFAVDLTNDDDELMETAKRAGFTLAILELEELFDD